MSSTSANRTRYVPKSKRIVEFRQSDSVKYAKRLCPGYYSRPVQEWIEKQGETSVQCPCAVWGQKVIPIYKDGGWIPKESRCSSRDSQVRLKKQDR